MTKLTIQQIRDLLAGAGPGLTTSQAEQLETALREDKPVMVEELGLNFVPAVRE